jgi:hypothetical protein
VLDNNFLQIKHENFFSYILCLSQIGQKFDSFIVQLKQTFTLQHLCIIDTKLYSQILQISGIGFFIYSNICLCNYLVALLVEFLVQEQ